MAKTSGISQDKILEVAEAIISAKGAKDTSLSDIAKAVGISKGTLYYHYATKEALVYDITGRHFDRVIQGMIRLVEKLGMKMDPEEILAMLLEDLGEAHRISRLHLYLLYEVMSGNEEMRERYMVRYREWKQTMQSVLARLFGAEHPAHAPASAMLLVFVEGNTIRGTVFDDPAPYREMARCIHNLYRADQQNPGGQAYVETKDPKASW